MSHKKLSPFIDKVSVLCYFPLCVCGCVWAYVGVGMCISNTEVLIFPRLSII